jgi:hypothetical protein
MVNINIRKVIFHPNFIFVLMILIMSLVYEYQKVLFFRPQSIHFWRQTDCASQALNYYQNGMNLFKPEIHNQIADNYTSGYCVEECPIVFYFVAILYKIFGFHDWIYRLVNLLIFFTALFFLFQLIIKLTKNKWLSIFLSLLFFASPVLVYYANNYISNTTAFAFTIIGWYLFYLYYEKGQFKHFVLSVALMVVATLLKISELLSLFTISGLYVLELLKWIKLKGDNYLFPNKLNGFIVLIVALFICTVWYLYAHYYNRIHDQKYYIFGFAPFWTFDNSTIQWVWTAMKERWRDAYFHYSVLIGFALSFIFNLIFFNKANKIFILSMLSLFVGSSMLALLWFYNLHDHDYYFISIYILPIVSLITTIDILTKKFPNVVHNEYVVYFMFLLLALNIQNARSNLHNRYNGWENDGKTLFGDLFNITPYLDSLGIKQTDKIICMPDYTVNGTLYLANRRGYTSFNGLQDDSSKFDFFLKKDVKYLLLLGDDVLQKHSWLVPYTNNQIGEYGQVKVYSLLDDKSSVISTELTEYTCDVEKLDNNGHITDKSGTLKFIDTVRSDGKSLSGIYSVKLDRQNMYGLTTNFNQVKKSDEYEISAWRYPAGANGTIVACIKSVNDYYNGSIHVIGKNSAGWEEIILKIKVPAALDNCTMSINLMYTGDSYVYFDDLRIKATRKIWKRVKN